jgi:hypothetical protein
MFAKIRELTARQVSLMVAAATIFGIVGAVSVAQAAPAGKPTKEQCAAAGYRNYGQCVKVWAHNKGYGG